MNHLEEMENLEVFALLVHLERLVRVVKKVILVILVSVVHAERLVCLLHGQSAFAFKSLGWKLLEERRVEMKARMMYKTVNKLPVNCVIVFKTLTKLLIIT